MALTKINGNSIANPTNFQGNLTVANLFATSYFYANGDPFTGGGGGTGSYSNANVANYLPTYGGNVGTGAGYILGNGAFLTGVAGAYGNADVANYLPTYTGNLAGANLVLTRGAVIAGNTIIQANLQVVGNITALNINDLEVSNLNIFLANNAPNPAAANSAGLVIRGANANMLYNSISNSIVFTHPISAQNLYANSNVAAYLPSYGGNIAANAITTTVPGGFVLSSEILTVGNAQGGVVRASNYNTGQAVTFSAAGNITATTGNINFSNANITVTGNITSTSGFYLGNGSLLTGINANVGPNTLINGNLVGYRNIPQIVPAATQTLSLADSGCHYYVTSTGNTNVTVPPNSAVPFALGTTVTFVLQAAGNINILQGAGVSILRAGGGATAQNRVLTSYGIATLLKTGTDTWWIQGQPLT